MGEGSSSGGRSTAALWPTFWRAARARAITPTITRGTVLTTWRTRAAETAAAGVAPNVTIEARPAASNTPSEAADAGITCTRLVTTSESTAARTGEGIPRLRSTA